MSQWRTLELPIAGMACAECTQHVQQAVAALPGVQAVQVLLAAEKAIIQLDPRQVDLPAIQRAVAGAGYSVPPPALAPPRAQAFTRQVLGLFGIVFGVVLLVVVVGEWL